MRVSYLLPLLAVVVPGGAQAQFVAHEALVVRGSYAVIGNGLIDCPTAATCDNNDSFMGPIDFDPLALGDRDGDTVDDTTMSSASTLALPPGAVVRAAYLAINGYGSSSITTDAGPPWTSTRTPDYPALFAAVGGAYAQVLPYDVRPYLGGLGYHARYDVTALVAGPGQYWVANARLPPVGLPYNRLLSWTLVVVYEDGSPPKLVTIYDGALSCGNNTTTVPIGGFLTPAGGPVSALFTIVANDGYAPGPNAESVLVGSLAVSNPQNPSNNIGNGTVSGPNGPIDRLPSSFRVTEPIDIDTFDVSSAFSPAQSSVDLTFSCQNDGVLYTGMVLGLDVLLPELQAQKSVTDLSGGETLPGDVLAYRVDVQVGGGDDAVGVELRDPIPAGTTFVPGSIRLVGSSTVALTDLIGDDAGEYQNVSREVLVHLGTLGIGSAVSVRFEVTVDTTSVARTIANVAELSFRGAQGGSGGTASVVHSQAAGGLGPTVIDAVPCAGFGAGGCPDAGVAADAEAPDALEADGGALLDAGEVDAGSLLDAGAVDAGSLLDAGEQDAGALPDVGAQADAGARPDAGAPRVDAGSAADAGSSEPEGGGCGCGVQRGARAELALGLLALLGLRRRWRRSA